MLSLFMKMLLSLSDATDQQGKLWSMFLGLVTEPDGTANTIVAAIKGVLQKHPHTHN